MDHYCRAHEAMRVETPILHTAHGHHMVCVQSFHLGQHVDVVLCLVPILEQRMAERCQHDVEL